MVVATPLPPLNFSHTGKLWPSTVARPAKSPASMRPTKPQFLDTTSTTSAPLPTSSSSVTTANDLLPVLSTLVAPMLPDPIRRMSPSPAMRVNTSPKGMEPIR